MYAPGQIIGLILFVMVVLLLAAALTWLDRRISADPAEANEATPQSASRSQAASAPVGATSRRTARSGRTRK